MKELDVDVAIIGAGSAGLSAYREAAKKTERIVVIEGGQYGTTCARVGCMPSKVLIQIARDFARRETLAIEGIRGGELLSVDGPAVMARVRTLRDRFVKSTMHSVTAIGDRNLRGRAVFESANTLVVDDHTRVKAKTIVLATGSRPVFPAYLREFGDRVITSDEIFELETLPRSVAVLGLGVIGVELGQAMARLGVDVTGISRGKNIGGLTDPAVNKIAIDLLGRDFPLWLGQEPTVEAEGAQLRVTAGARSVLVDKVLLALGRQPNVDGLGLDRLGIACNARGVPDYDPRTLQVGKQRLFIAGDAKSDRPILHEAADDGRVAGYNSVRDRADGFHRRVPLNITFSDPDIATVGMRFKDLGQRAFVVGEIDFSGQGRSIVRGEHGGMLRVYGDPESGRLLGAEMAAPAGEHLAHYLAVLMQRDIDVFQALHLPIYHPVVEEGMRTALRELAHRVRPHEPPFELALCDSAAPEGTE